MNGIGDQVHGIAGERLAAGEELGSADLASLVGWPERTGGTTEALVGSQQRSRNYVG